MNASELNLDPAELAKFEALASRWWDPESEFKPLHDINPIRMEYIAQRVDFTDKKVIDIGCGGGLLSEAMAQRGARVVGIDMGETPLRVAELHRHESNVDVSYEKSTAENYARSHHGEFDVVTCLELLEHVPDPASTVAACCRLVKPGGQVFFSTINRNPKSWLFAIVGAEYIMQLLPKGTHDYEKFIRPSELESWCRQVGLTFQELIGLHYNPISTRYWMGPGVDVNYMAYCLRDDA